MSVSLVSATPVARAGYSSLEPLSLTLSPLRGARVRERGSREL